MHWTQETATVYLLAVLRKRNDDIQEDHMVFCLSAMNDKLHDVCFVELCNAHLYEHYKNERIQIEHNGELNDSCASQFKYT